MFFESANKVILCGMFSVGHLILFVITMLGVEIALRCTKNAQPDTIKEIIKKSTVILWILEIIKIILNNKDDVRLKYFLNEYIENLAIGISNLINIFEPEKILIGGGFSDYKEILLEPLKQQLLTGNLLFNKRNDIIIQLAKFKNDAGIIGATLI